MLYNTDKMGISIIFINFNGEKWNKKFLESIKNQTYKNFEVIVVDNNSTDKSLDSIKKEFSFVKIIKNNKNLGFSKSINKGIQNCIYETVLIVNNDTWMEKDFLERMLDFYIKNQFSVIAPYEKNYYKKGNEIQCLRLDFTGFPKQIYEKTYPDKSFYLSGVCLLFDKSVYKDTGGFDNSFFMYCEETDWFWRLNLYDIKFSFVPNLFIYHAGAGSSEPGTKLKLNIFYSRNKNNLEMLLKNYALISLLIFLPFYFLQNIFEIMFYLLTNNRHYAISYFRGWYDILINIKEILKKRKEIQSRRKISEFKIFQKMYFGFAKLDLLMRKS